MQTTPPPPYNVDPQSESLLASLTEQERVRANKVAGVRSVLVVLSARAMVYDRESLRQKILHTYPQAVVFFQAADGKSIGASSPKSVDLLIDFTNPGARQGLFAAKKLRKLARVAVGRNAGLFRKKLYDRVFDEKGKNASTVLGSDALERERSIQKQVLALAGVPLSQSGDPLSDDSQTIALGLPSMNRL
jgi:hypothetical protein